MSGMNQEPIEAQLKRIAVAKLIIGLANALRGQDVQSRDEIVRAAQAIEKSAQARLDELLRAITTVRTSL